jgi:hypothetical protein
MVEREEDLGWRRDRKRREGLRLRDHLEAGPAGLRRKAKPEPSPDAEKKDGEEDAPA